MATNVRAITNSDKTSVCSSLGVSGDLQLCGMTSAGGLKVQNNVYMAINAGWSNAKGLINGWESGTGAYDNIKNNLQDFKDYIISKSQSAGIDPYFIVALFAIESSGNPWDDNGSYHGLGQTAKKSTPSGDNLEQCKGQVDVSIAEYVSKAKTVGVNATNYFVVAMSYNAGEALFLNKGYLDASNPSYQDLVNKTPSYCQSVLGVNTDAKKYEIQAYYPKLLAARQCLAVHKFLGDVSTVSGNIKTKKDFETNEETDWLLDPSDDERKYGINIYEGQQPLIKFSTKNGIDESGTAVEALKKYSEFLYYLLNSEVSTASVQCLSMPWIRPGFNVWYDPLYADRVYYCMAVQHQGDPQSGARTSLSLVLGRPSSVFVNDKDKFGSLNDENWNVLISEMIDKYRVSKFGDTLDTSSEFNAVKDATKAYYSSESFETVSAEHSEFHKELYGKGVGTSPLPDSVDKNKIFSGEYTKAQIESQLAALYGNAPSVIKDRVSKLKEVVAAADEYIETYHLLEHHTN